MKSKKRAREASPKPTLPPVAAVTDTRVLWGISIALAAVTLLLYARAFHYGFIDYDDNQYVRENPMVKAGLSWAGIRWAFTTIFYANWHPLAWISHMLDVQLFGMNTGWFHAVNVVLHTAAAVLLFLALQRMTRQPWRCAIVAAIFALHPLHVESVAWISERKDVLSTFLEMVALLLYARFVESRTVGRYLAVFAVFALALMAKPMLVTFPLVLLLLDFWPLRRAEWPLRWAQWKPLVMEKLPLLALSAIGSVMTFIAQHSYGAVVALQRFPVLSRLENSALAYVAYIGTALWPVNLAVFYPASPLDAAGAVLAALFLLGVTAAVLRFAKSRPYLATGWFWYLGILAPVIGIVQVGAQSRADRYTYVPLVGLSMAVVWLVADWAGRQRAAAVVAGLILAALGAGTYHQLGYWESSRELFEHTLAITEKNPIMNNDLGVVLAADGDYPGAAAEYQKAIAILPDYSDARANLGHALLKMGQFQQAAAQLDEALRLQPTQAEAHADVGLLMAAQGDYASSARHLSEALRLKPDDAVNESNLCFALLHSGETDQALRHCREALRLKPDLPDAHFNLGNVLVAQGQIAEARAEFTRSVSLNPANAAARQALQQLEGK